MRLVHPVVDEWGEDYVVYATPVSLVRLTDVFAGFLEAAADEHRRPVLVTPVSSRVSAFVSLAMRRAGGFWAAQKPSGQVYDALSGFRIGHLSNLWRPPSTKRRPRLATFDQPWPGLRRVVTFDVRAHYRATDSTVLGVLAEDVVAGLGTTGLDSWDTCEPLARAWDQAAITEHVKKTMPVSPVFHGSGPGGAFIDMQVARTRLGLLEHTQGGVPVPVGPTRLAEYVDAAIGLLEELAAKFQVTIAFTSLAEWDQDLTQRVRARPPESPLAVLIGAKGVRDLGIDVAELAAAHPGVKVIGRAKVPSVIVPFSDPTRGLWEQVLAFAGTLDPARVAAAIGLPDTPSDTAGGGR